MDALHISLLLYNGRKQDFPQSLREFDYILVCYFRLPPLDVCKYAFGVQTKISHQNPLASWATYLSHHPKSATADLASQTQRRV